MLLKTYADFLDRAEELGFMAFSNTLPGLPTLSEETLKKNWHTGDSDTDPWCWRNRVVEEKRFAFGCILGGHKGFVSSRMYSLFYKACHPTEHIEENRAAGLVSDMVWQLWQLFEKKTLLDTSSIRKEVGVTRKKGGSKVDTAIKELQKNYYITVAGHKRKMNQKGEPYGWPVNTYDKVTNWAPKEWMKLGQNISREEAREIILDNGMTISTGISREKLLKILGFDRLF